MDEKQEEGETKTKGGLFSEKEETGRPTIGVCDTMGG